MRNRYMAATSALRYISANSDDLDRLRLFAEIVDQSCEAILVTDRENRIIDINPAFTLMTGYLLEEIVGQDPKVLSSGKTSRETYADLWRSLELHGRWQGELWDKRKDGSVYPKWSTISTLRNDIGLVTHYIANFVDMSERKASEALIDRLIHHDDLTGLPNRHGLSIRMEHAFLGAQRGREKIAVLVVDMDRFKNINDTLGHATGDLLLVEVAHRLRKLVRESDIVARQGGDEFVVVLTGMSNVSDVLPLANKMLRVLGEPYFINDRQLRSTPSIGVALYPDDGRDAMTLLQCADAAMYFAKECGRNNVQYFVAEMTKVSRERMEMEDALRESIEHGYFELFYQPQVETKKKKIVAVEALLRWRHPVFSGVSPERFIPLAEESGLIGEIGLWVLDTACRQLAIWKSGGVLGLRMAVNISAQQLRSLQLVQQVSACLERHGIATGELELEVTESVAMENPELSISQLHGLCNLGVSLAIDDFGTGYSSLSYLKHLPIQTLKLDKSFVRDIESDANDAAICAATVALAHTLGLQVVAEGVETLAQAEFLGKKHRCDVLQGYLFGRPLSADMTTLILQKRQWPKVRT